jgi:hypothetical protein
MRDALERGGGEVLGESRVGRPGEAAASRNRRDHAAQADQVSPRVFEGREDRLVALMTARPDATLAELRDARPTTPALSTRWREIDRLGFRQKRDSPTTSAALMSPPRGASGKTP